MARARARLSPSSRRSARSAVVLPGAAMAGGRLVPLYPPHPDTPNGAARMARRVLPGQVQVVAPAVAGVAVVAHPAERTPWAVLPGLGPAGQAVHVVPGSSRARVKVHGQAQRMLSARLVPVPRVAVAHPHVVAADEVEDVAENAPVHPGAELAGDGHEAAPRPDRQQPAHA